MAAYPHVGNIWIVCVVVLVELCVCVTVCVLTTAMLGAVTVMLTVSVVG